LGDRLSGTGQVAIEVLWPPPRAQFKNANDTSVVLRLTYAGRRILLCGDIGPEPQTQLIAAGDLKADVLVLPHHGSVDLMTEPFLRAVDPAVCIRSGGRRNAGPSGGIHSLMGDRQFYDTARDGAVTVCITPKDINVCRGPDEQSAGHIPGGH
jgi:competence protein ComEC